LAIAKGSGRIFKREFDSAQSSSTSAISETSYAKVSGTVSNRLQDIFHQDDDDFDELDDEPPSRYRKGRDVFNANRLDDDIERAVRDRPWGREHTRSSSRKDRHIYFQDRALDPNNRLSLPRPLSDFDLIKVDGKLSISIDELMAEGIVER
jgi:hypothetical protein